MVRVHSCGAQEEHVEAYTCNCRPSSALKIFTVHIPTVELYVHSDTNLTTIRFIQQDPAINTCVYVCVFTLIHAMCGTMAVETSRATQGQGNATHSQNGARAIMECVYIVYR